MLGGRGAEGAERQPRARPARPPAAVPLPRCPAGSSPGVWPVGNGTPSSPPGRGPGPRRNAGPGAGGAKASRAFAPRGDGLPRGNVGAKERGGERKHLPRPSECRARGEPAALGSRLSAPPGVRRGRRRRNLRRAPERRRRAGCHRPGQAPGRGAGQERSRPPTSVAPGAPRRGRPVGRAAGAARPSRFPGSPCPPTRRCCSAAARAALPARSWFRTRAPLGGKRQKKSEN